MINPIIHHYSFENPGTIFDEEAMTALELAGRTAKKVNECIEQVNQIPAKVSEDVQKHIDNGDFDKQVDKYAGNVVETVTKEIGAVERDLGNRLDTLLGSVTEGSTTADAELYDIRAGGDGHSYPNAGTAVRAQMATKMEKGNAVHPKAHTANLLTEDGIITGYYYSADTGEYAQFNNACHYPPVAVPGNTKLTLFNAQIFTCLDASGNVLTTESKANNAFVSVTTPENCAYVVVSKSISNTKPSGVYLGDYSGTNEEGENLITPNQVVGLADTLRVLVEDTVKRTPGKNMFNRNSSNIVLNKYVDAASGNEGDHPSYNYVRIPVDGGQSYVVSPPANYHIAFFNDAGVFIGGVSGLENTHFTAPEECNYVTLSYPQHLEGTLQMEAGDIATNYTPFTYGVGGEDINPEAIRVMHLAPEVQQAINASAVVTIGPNDCDYTSILEALATEGENTVFHVYSGVYDIEDEYKAYYESAYFDNYTGYHNTNDVNARGLYLKPGCEIHGIGDVEIKFPYTGTNEAVKNYFSTINTSYNNVLENLILTMADRAGRYHIHDDFAIAGIPGNTVIRNIRMYGIPMLGTAIGSGMGTMNTYLIENCVMDIPDGTGIAYHNNIQAGRNRLIIRNCWMNGVIWLRSYGSSTEKSVVQISGCRCNGIHEGFSDSATYPNVNMEVFAWNNEIV